MPTPAQAASFIALESEDYDGLGGANGYGWARATTDDVAAGIGVSTEEAYRLLKAAAKKGLVHQDAFRRKGVSTGRFGASQVGWAIWEVHLTREQTIERDGEAREPDERSVKFHRDAVLDEFVRGEQVTGKTMLRAAEACGVDIEPALKRALNKPGIWVRPLTSNLPSDAQSAHACAIYGTLRQSGDQSMKPNIRDDEVDEAPPGPRIVALRLAGFEEVRREFEGRFRELSERRARLDRAAYREERERLMDEQAAAQDSVNARYPLPAALAPNASHYVWVLFSRSDTPISSEGPFGPYSQSVADQFARIGASEGIHDRAVSVGKDPEARGFKIERRYAARTGTRLL
jgi:hypothetical protein